jgi:Domain of unknown function (DUF1707)
VSGEIERIGDAAREKWLPFLARALELGYLDLEEYTRRMEALLAARTRDELLPVVEGLDWKPWAAAWDKSRKSTAILPEPVSRRETGFALGAIGIFGVLCVLGWVLYFVTVI